MSLQFKFKLRMLRSCESYLGWLFACANSRFVEVVEKSCLGSLSSVFLFTVVSSGSCHRLEINIDDMKTI